MVKLKVAKLPAQVTKRHLYGTSVLVGIGFTMSIFVLLIQRSINLYGTNKIELE